MGSQGPRGRRGPCSDGAGVETRGGGAQTWGRGGERAGSGGAAMAPGALGGPLGVGPRQGEEAASAGAGWCRALELLSRGSRGAPRMGVGRGGPWWRRDPRWGQGGRWGVGGWGAARGPAADPDLPHCPVAVPVRATRPRGQGWGGSARGGAASGTRCPGGLRGGCRWPLRPPAQPESVGSAGRRAALPPSALRPPSRGCGEAPKRTARPR